jgi:hypothetical protein
LAQRGVVPIEQKNLIGINRRDSSDRVQDNEFYTIQNLYFKTKCQLWTREGASYDLQASQVPLASKITGLHRHYNPNKERWTIYHCEPNSTSFPDPTTDLTLAEISGGDLFAGGAVEVMRFCYTWVGCGMESALNSHNRTGYVQGTFGSLVSAAANPGHQSITVSANTKGVRVTVPAFPSGVSSANIFAARGASTQMTYIGTITASGGSFDFKHFIGPVAAASDALTGLTGAAVTGGSLKPGVYYVAAAWITDTGAQEGALPTVYTPTSLCAAVQVVLESSDSAIQVGGLAAASTNGAKAAYVFIGTKSEKDLSMIWVGNIKTGETLTISSIPDGSNAQSHPDLAASDTTSAKFIGWVLPSAAGSGGALTARMGFLIKKDSGGTVTQIATGRTILWLGVTLVYDPIYASIPPGGSWGQSWYWGQIRTTNDKIGTQPYNWGRTIYPPSFTYLNGLSFFANGIDIIWQTDGRALGQIARASGTTLPPYPRFLATFQSCLLAAGAEAKNQIYSSNANSPQNWAAGGTGTAKRFVTIGDLFGDEATALGIFSYADQAINDPRSFFCGFKKNGVWIKDSFPDPSGGVGSPTQQLDGAEGCTSYRSIRQTPLGLVYLSPDGMVRLIRGAGKPVEIGGRVKPLLSHLQLDDSLAQKVTAVYHKGHYKLSYPSTPTSTYNDAELWADLQTAEGSTITWTGPHLVPVGGGIADQIVLNGESDDHSRLGVCSNSLNVAKLEDLSTYLYLGSSMSRTITTKDYRAGANAHLKRLLSLLAEIYFDSQFTHSVLFEAFLDDLYAQKNITLSSGAAVWDTSAYDLGAKFGSARFNEIAWHLSPEQNLSGRTAQFRITLVGDAQMILASMLIILKPERRIVT